MHSSINTTLTLLCTHLSWCKQECISKSESCTDWTYLSISMPKHTSFLIKQITVIPEELTLCILSQFKVNRAQLLPKSRVQDMITNANNSLKDVLLAEVRSSRGTAHLKGKALPEKWRSESCRWPTGTLVDVHMWWTWGWHMHMGAC